jgi:hypothetical protein
LHISGLLRRSPVRGGSLTGLEEVEMKKGGNFIPQPRVPESEDYRFLPKFGQSCPLLDGEVVG